MNNEIVIKPIPEYRRIQRELEMKARRVFRVNPGMVLEGGTIRDHNGREYVVAPDGSWRRKDRSEGRTKP